MRALTTSAVQVHAHNMRCCVHQSRLPVHLSYQSHRPGQFAELPVFPGCPPPHAAQQNTPAAEPAHIGVSMSAFVRWKSCHLRPKRVSCMSKGTSEDGAPGCAAVQRMIWLEILGTCPTNILRATAVPAVLPHATSDASSALLRRQRACCNWCLRPSVQNWMSGAQGSHVQFLYMRRQSLDLTIRTLCALRLWTSQCMHHSGARARTCTKRRSETRVQP